MTVDRIGQLTAETRDVEDLILLSSLGENPPSISTTRVKTGTYSYAIDTGTNPFGISMSSVTGLRAGWWLNHSGLSAGDGDIAVWHEAGSEDRSSVRWDDGGDLLILEIAGVDVASVSASEFGFNNTNVWFHVGIVIKTETPVLAFYLNGDPVISYEGDLGANVGAFYIGGDRSLVGWTASYVDDFYIDEITDDEPTSPPPGKRFLFSLTSAAGADADWTPAGAGSNYQAVDDSGAPDGDTTYNKALTDSLLDTFQTADITLPTDYVIRAVIPVAVAKKTDPSGDLNLRVHVYDGSTYAQSSNLGPNTIYRHLWGRFTLQPDSSPWNEVDFNAMQFGYRSV